MSLSCVALFVVSYVVYVVFLLFFVYMLSSAHALLSMM